MAAEEVTCGIFSGVVFADARSSLLFSPRLREGKGLLVVAPLFASHQCCDWNHINFDAVFFFFCFFVCPSPPRVVHMIIVGLVCLYQSCLC